VRTLFKGPDYGKLCPYYPFKSEAAEKRYHDYYHEREKAWPKPFETRVVETSYGSTLVRISGKEDAPPLVLFPSASASSLIWLPNIEGLAPHFRIYAVDNIYDIGLSVNKRPVTDAVHLTEWLDELLTKLEIKNNVSLMGLSFGGWLTSQYALRHQERLARVVLAAPAATIHPLPGAWAWRAILGVLPPRRFFMRHFLINWMCKGLVKKGDDVSRRMLDHWVNDAMMAMQCFAFRMPVAPTVLTDDELRSLKIPVLLVVGEDEVIYPASKAVQRINAVAPSITTTVIQNASHDLTISQTEAFNSRVVSFLLDQG
jgi:pimeloyl-ACP methyl ester carboxylesterase